MADLRLPEITRGAAPIPRRATRASLITRGFLGLMGGGKAGKELALHVDQVRAIGARTSLESQRQRSRFRGAEADSAVYREIWEHAAASCGAEVMSPARGFYEFCRDGRRTLVWRHLVKLDDVVTVQVALDKPLVQRMLTDVGLTVPEHVVVQRERWRSAAGFVAQHAPCVVKPATNTAGGTGVTGSVASEDDLARAAIRAGRYNDVLLIERQVIGEEFRFLLLDDEPLDVLYRTPPSVVGDGSSTVWALIRAENERRRAAGGTRGLWPVRLDLDCVLTLRRTGYALDSVPGCSVRVGVKSTVSESGSADSHSVDDYPAELLEVARQAARTLGARFCSVELISTRQDAGHTAALIEINGTPGLHYHYQVADAERCKPVAVPLLATLLGCEPPAGWTREPPCEAGTQATVSARS